MTSPFRTLLLLPLLLLVSQLAQAATLTPAETLQLHANRATVSLLLLRGEGFQDSHLTRLQDDINNLQQATQAAAASDSKLQPLSDELVRQLQAGVSYGPGEENMPWRYPEELAKSLRELLAEASAQDASATQGELPAKVEYLAVQYLARAYLGNFEIAREAPEHYLGQDERKLVPDIDRQLAELGGDDPAQKKLKVRWNYLRNALLDMNSGSNALASSSGRAFAPTTVDRHARALTDQWLEMPVTR